MKDHEINYIEFPSRDINAAKSFFNVVFGLDF